METPEPLVSVVMTSYRDSFPRVMRSVQSMLDQTFRDLELLIAFEPDDPNADLLLATVSDPRLIVLKNTQHSGMAGSFNRCLSRAHGRYIARLDSDDWAYPDRLEKQIAFLAEHPEISVVGGQVTLVDEAHQAIGQRTFPTEHRAIVHRFMLVNAMCHPTVVWDRRKIGELRYSLDVLVEDLELWFRLLSQGHRFANLDSALIKYKQPDGRYCRPMRVWRDNFRARAMYWRLGLRYPELLIGIMAFAVIAVIPQRFVDRLTERSGWSDHLRSIQKPN